MGKSKFDKPFVVIDLGSGSYLQDSEGHEKYNEIRNPKTGKFYGYCPPLGNLNIRKLGAKAKDTMVSGVTIVYVRKANGSSDREISSFIEDATVYGQLQDGRELDRIVQSKMHGAEFAVYSIESDDLVKVDDIPGSEKFIIKTKDYSPSMFRMQRFYKGTYPELDKRIIDYLDSLK